MKASSSVHDFHKFAIHHNGVSPVLHFHLACSINPDTDIPLLPITGNKDDVESNFRLHWMNNKDMEFTMEAERLLQDLHQRLLAEEASVGMQSSNRTNSDDDDDDEEEEEEDEDAEERFTSNSKRKNASPPSKRNGFPQNESQGSLSSAEEQEKEEEVDHPPEFPIHLLQSGILDRLDRKIDALLLDWHSSPDYVFSIHPVDGSFLVWLIDHLDESTPFTFHQAQASFSSRLPRAFPIPDARSMASNIIMYCNYDRSDARMATQLSESLQANTGTTSGAQHSNLYNPLNPSRLKELLLPDVLVPSIHMVTKHTNGTLNQWQVRFAENTKFQNIVSVSHVARACGHRFRTNSAACHPVLPLMLTTSHHNLPPSDSPTQNACVDPFIVHHDVERTNSAAETPDVEQVGPTFCSELILWQVMPVGPLSASGGIVELCRINNSCQSAFTNVAWVPTLLPSTSLGAYSNSPSALFVASDGQCLRLFQAVIDARSLLLEKTTNSTAKTSISNVSTSSASSYHELPVQVKKQPAELFNIISLQSSARPGCILELDAISDGCQDWRNVQLLHVYQEQLITGRESGGESEAVVDLSGQSTFDENFFLVVVEKDADKGCVLHMWKITIDSKPSQEKSINGDYEWNHDENMVDSYNDELSPEGLDLKSKHSKHSASGQIMIMSVKTIKVLTQTLSLTEDVEVISVAPAGGHLSSASIYPACFAPYQFVTACSDGEVRFWNCNVSTIEGSLQETSICSVTSYEFSMDDGGDPTCHPQVHVKQEPQLQELHYKWAEWVRPSSVDDKASSVTIRGQPIAVSCAYSGRIAVAYRSGPIRTQPERPEEKFVNLRVVILECESTGGSEWMQEDTIELNNIKIPDPKHEIDMCMLQGYEMVHAPPTDPSGEAFSSAQAAAAFMTRTKSVPSLSTIQSVKKSISEAGNRKGLLSQKCLVQLDWVATEDGSHLLTVGVGSKVLIYGQVSNEIANSLKTLRGENAEPTTEEKRSAFASSKRITMNKSMVSEDFQEEIKWMRLKGIELSSADGLPPLPMHINWVRAGILVVGMDNEMQVFSQWRSSSDDSEVIEDEATIDKRNLTEANLVTAASSLNLCNNFKSKTNFKTSMSLSNLRTGALQSSSKKDALKRSNQTSASSKLSVARSDSLSSLPMLYDSGLFDAARFANPVLPQYHPKLLTELLNCGKIRRVKAVLAHLVRCISSSNGVQTISAEDQMASRPRSVSMHNESDPLTRDTSNIHYVEIKSIPPLPLYALIAADKETTPLPSEMKSSTHQTNKEPDYSDLLDTNIQRVEDDLDEQLLSTSADSVGSLPKRSRLPSGNKTGSVNPYSFNTAQADVLREYLYKLNLPGLSGNDQFHLAALAEVMGSTTLGLGENTAENHQTEQQGSVDECGLRFLLALRQYQCLVKTLPPFKRQSLMEAGIRTSYVVWGFHSESSEVLLQAIPCVKADEPVWEELKVYGVGWWLSSMTQLKTLMLKVANTAFKKSKKPMDAALYYLAMKKKTIVKSLFKTVHDGKMETFFGQDFENEKNRRIAMKNAYHLLSKGQYQHAVALFFLAGQIDMAVNVILDKLEDLQLAIVLCRLHDGESMLPDSVKRLFYENILGLDANGENYEAKKAHPDPFLRSMALWQLKDYQSSLQTLLERNVGKAHSHDEKQDRLLQLPRVFNFYNFLRIHPLITRLRLASSSQQRRKKLISGFTHANTLVSEGISTLDQVTPSERRLFFAAAHAHFQNGCPLVAIEVMRKLPKSALLVEEDLQQMEYFAKRRRKSMLEINKTTGTLDDAFSLQNSVDVTSAPTTGKSSDKAADLFNSTFASSDSSNKAGGIDWGQPLTTATSIDWSAPSKVNFVDDLDLELDLGLGGSDDEDDDGEGGDNGADVENKKTDLDMPTLQNTAENIEDSQDQSKEQIETKHIDIMAQQYKFIACLKVIMEELGNLATGFEVDGGQLRHQLYIWLEKEVEILSVLCDYGTPSAAAVPSSNKVEMYEDADEESDWEMRPRSASMRINTSAGKASLHEVIKAEKQDLQSKVARMARRKAWLRANQHLLRTLASYCILQGSGGGGLASVRMELLLLLQELQQERPQQQLLSPLPFPTTLPLLSATITNSRSVIADPIQYLQGNIQDLLHAVVEMPLPPSAQTDIGLVSTIRDLSVALSSCIYQSLCDSDSFNVEVAEAGLDGFINPEFSYPSSHLMAGVKRSRQRNCSAGECTVNTPPAKWPGVASLKVLLAREKDEDSPRINIMLTEALISVYMSLLISGLSMYDSQMLYRLVANKLDTQTWNALFGGGNKTAIKSDKIPMRITNQDDSSKHRMMFNLRVMSSGGAPPGTIRQSADTKETFREIFVPPEISMVNYFMTKPFVPSAETILDYDSDDSFASDDDISSDDEDYDDEDDDITQDKKITRPTSLMKQAKSNVEHTDPGSYSWCIIRYAVIKSVIANLNTFLPQIGIELTELPNASPFLHAVMKVLDQWQDILQSRLDLFGGAPNNYIPGLMIDVATGQPLSKLQALFLTENTPFLCARSTLPIKRLWFHLIKQESLRDIFLRYVYKKRQEPDDSMIGSMKTSSSENEQPVKDPMKIVHKEQDIITAFAINQANSNLMVLSTQKEVVELDIGYLLKPPVWLEDDNEYDIETLRNPNPGPEAPEFLVVQTPMDTVQPSSTSSPSPSSQYNHMNTTPYMPSPSPSLMSVQTGRGSSVILRRPVLGVRRIGSHPVLPHYMTGGADGAVRLWEWGHGHPITTLRQAGSFPKVTKVLFNAQGNKCCVSDVEGSICLWQVGLGSAFNKPIMSFQCHNKTTSDFQFVGSSSMIATAGQSSENRNVCLWDTLLPLRSSLVHAFQCHEQGSPAVVYASRHHLLISGGRKGEICIFDLRQRKLKHTFQAHEAPIKCLTLDPDEDYFVTGSAEGDIKVWGLKIHQLIFSFPGEHSKTTFFKNVGSTSGVAQLHVGALNHLYSCGVDGSMKLRQLPERELVVHHWA
ncbi:Dmx-like protein 2 [Plakobranchus ocellatus]|uniref:Dmx-like protein 2 n=1 Tax=Plakobranchus ocellatus TaxID=259542 RepID=A0AAV4C9I3_9GAST|nr:Dmx-like protein 2 [Plakobranchus ocellatus]